MASPFNYTSGDAIHFCFRPECVGSPVRAQQKGGGVLWFNEIGTFRGWYEEDGKRVGMLVDWGPWLRGRILFSDLLWWGEPKQIQEAKHVPPASGAPKPPNGKQRQVGRVSLK